MKRFIALAVAGLLACHFAGAAATAQLLDLTAAPAPAMAAADTTPQQPWKNSPIGDPNYFPISVWLQQPAKAAQYKAIGINVYLGIWQGPTEQDLATLRRAGMQLICVQNDVTLKHLDSPTIIGWMDGSEPDNAQLMDKYWKNDLAAIKKAWPNMPEKSLEQWGKYGPPIAPNQIIDDYRRMKKNDPTRPVRLGFGQPVAWDLCGQRGVRTNHPEDYLQYMKGGDVISYDIYPINTAHPDVYEKLWLVPFGLDRLADWTKGEKVIWNVIECTQYSEQGRRPTPHEVKAEVWMSIIHGSRGITYFCHQFKPTHMDAALLADKQMAQAVGRINKQITELAAVINSPDLPDAATVTSSRDDAPIDIMVKKHDGATYIFAVSMRPQNAKAVFTINDIPAKATADVLSENRSIPITDGRFTDTFDGYDVHLYKIAHTVPAKSP